MVILLCVVLVIFSIVQTKSVHYSSLAYFPVTFLAALAMERFCMSSPSEKGRVPKGLKMALFTTAFLIAAVFIALPFFMKNTVHFAGQFGNEFVKASLLADVNWTGWEMLPGLVLLAGLGVMFWFVRTKRPIAVSTTLFVTMTFTTSLAVTVIFPKVLQHTQGAAIEFYQSKATEDCYVDHIGGKSFLDLFYTKKPFPDNPNHADSYWLMRKKTGKPTYFVIRIDRLHKLEGYDGKMVEIGRKDGFVFYERIENE